MFFYTVIFHLFQSAWHKIIPDTNPISLHKQLTFHLLKHTHLSLYLFRTHTTFAPVTMPNKTFSLATCCKEVFITSIFFLRASLSKPCISMPLTPSNPI